MRPTALCAPIDHKTLTRACLPHPPATAGVTWLADHHTTGTAPSMTWHEQMIPGMVALTVLFLGLRCQGARWLPRMLWTLTISSVYAFIFFQVRRPRHSARHSAPHPVGLGTPRLPFAAVWMGPEWRTAPADTHISTCSPRFGRFLAFMRARPPLRMIRHLPSMVHFPNMAGLAHPAGNTRR